MSPTSRACGFDRGTPIDRYYIEAFLSCHTADIRGVVLEFGDDRYTRKFGASRVTQSHVLEVVPGNSKATIVADLSRPNSLPDDTFDCIICTQTLQFVYDVRMAVQQLFRILKPDGVLLVTVNGISKIARREGIDPWGEYWRFTEQSLGKMLREVFQAADVTLEVYGNAFAAASSLYGLAAEELRAEELDYSDRDFEVTIAARAVKLSPRRSRGL